MFYDTKRHHRKSSILSKDDNDDKSKLEYNIDRYYCNYSRYRALLATETISAGFGKAMASKLAA